MVDMLSCWLSKADRVDANGGPTWTTLATTLKDMGCTDNIVSYTIKM